MTAKSPLPVDAAQYLIQAAEAIAKEQGFKPESPEAMGKWLSQNMVQVAKRASEMQWDLLNKIEKNKDAVTKVMSAKVWGDINRQEITRQENQGIASALD